MSYRQGNSTSRDYISQPQTRLKQRSKPEITDEGCPVLEESGSVCGETNSLCVFQEFRQMYDNCLKKLEGTQDGAATLKKLAPFKSLIDDLWAQNTMLVETVEELEQEATSRVTSLQDRLNKSCQKICEYEEDIRSLTKIIQRFCECGAFDISGLRFNTLSPDDEFQNCMGSSSKRDLQVEPEPETFSQRKSTSIQNPAFVTSSSAFARGKAVNWGSKMNRTSSKVLSPVEVEHCIARSENQSKYADNNLYKEQICPEYNPISNCFVNDFNQSTQSKSMTSNEKDCQEHQRPINIHFNLRKDRIINSSDCCCNCSCPFSSSEESDC